MSTYFVMMVFLLAGNSDGGVAIQKVGVYESRSDCMASGVDAGLSHISTENTRYNRYQFACVAAADPYGEQE